MEPTTTDLTSRASDLDGASLLRLGEPGHDEIEALAVSRYDVPLTYEAVGASRDETLPDGFASSQVHGHLGAGADGWRRARAAVAAYRMFQLPWIRLRMPDGPPEPGRIVAFASRQWGVWAMNVCRVVYVIDDDDGTIARYGFGYGTVRPHAVAGEERFIVTWDRRSDEVSFDIWKFSRPAHVLVRIAGPLGRMVQRRFDRDALRAMRQAVCGSEP